MTLSLTKNDKDEYIVTNPLKKGAAPDYKAMHNELVGRLGNSLATIDFQLSKIASCQLTIKELKVSHNESLSDRTILEKQQKNNIFAIHDLMQENSNLRSVIAELKKHWTHSFVPSNVKKKIASLKK